MEVKDFFKDVFVDSERVEAIRGALLKAYHDNDHTAIKNAAQEAQRYVDEGGDFPGEYDEDLEDYEGGDWIMLTNKYILRLLHDRYCDTDDDQQYIATGLTKEMRIFHTIRCIGRDFTSDEWHEYLKNERPEDDIALTTEDGYKFNIFDVCRNTTNEIDIKIDTYNYLEIGTAKSTNGRYDYDIHCAAGLGGFCNGASFIDNITKGYATKDEAVLKAIDIAEDYISRQDSKSAKTLLGKVKDARRNIMRPQPVQLSLFDF